MTLHPDEIDLAAKLARKPRPRAAKPVEPRSRRRADLEPAELRALATRLQRLASALAELADELEGGA